MASSLTFAIPVNWTSNRTYEINMIVFVGKKAYTALKDVPTGVEITNTEYWSETGVPYVDLSSIRSKLNELEQDIIGIEGDIDGLDTRITTNSGNIATLTTNLQTVTTNLANAVETMNNIMISLYTPYPSN